MGEKSTMESLEGLVLFKEFIGKKILITGHTGFKGSWLAIWLNKLGASVSGYSLVPENQTDNYVLSNIQDKINNFISDVRDYNKLFEIFKKTQPEIIFHLAAQPLVLKSYDNPLLTIETNVQGTANVLEAFRKSKKSKILVVITTDKVYKNDNSNKSFIENDVLGGDDIYSASKAATELLCYAYNKSFYSNKSIFTVRAGNVIGGGDWSSNRIVPDCIKSIENNKKILLRNPYSIRPWQHVLEPLYGYLLLVSKVINNESLDMSWNFGPDSCNEINVEYLVKSIIQKYGKGQYILKNDLNKPKESDFLSLNIDKAKNKLGWKPILSYDEMINFTVEWYKKYNISNVYDICLKQINQYEEFWKSRN